MAKIILSDGTIHETFKKIEFFENSIEIEVNNQIINIILSKIVRIVPSETY